MIRYIIFDLSEVLIAGLVGIETTLSQELPVPENEILRRFGGPLFHDLLVGKISEDTYLRQMIMREGWRVSAARLKEVIRSNFHKEVEGSLPLLTALAPRYELVLLSDHAREWIAHIRSIHSFLKTFKHTFFSYDLKTTKRNPETFLQVLDAISCSPHNCLFIDDNPINVQVAESVGIPSIQFRSAKQLTIELETKLSPGWLGCQG